MRLIDADAAIEVVHKWLEDIFCISSTEVTVFKRLRRLPTVDAEPVRHGRWIDDTDTCSECGQYVYHGDSRNYCPNCGAKMDEEEENAEKSL